MAYERPVAGPERVSEGRVRAERRTGSGGLVQNGTTRGRSWWCVLVALAVLVADARVPAQGVADDLTRLSLEELMNVEVALPSRRLEPRSRASAAVYVITQEAIRRSGVKTIPDALRLAPGVQVARINANQWAIGVRGFANRLSRSVLVLMDGRSVYNPLFAGTYWEVQDTVLDDIDRIEVIRGPGGTLWGANAFNGVINIVTKAARDTQGLLAIGGGGTEERGFGTVRYGGALGEDLFYRVYGKYFYRDGFTNPDGPSFDSWQVGRGGFRVDWNATAADTVTVQGDAYDGEIGESVGIAAYEPPFFAIVQKDGDVSGANLLGRWSHAFSPTAELVVQSYFDHTFRRDPNFTEQRDTWDLDAQHRFTLPWRQELLWGLEYRLSADHAYGVPTVQFIPTRETLHLVSAFVQDDIWLLPDRLRLTVGIKFESTTYADFEYQPSGSLLWLITPQHSLWGSISRAVRTPSRIERDLLLTARPLNSAPPFETCVTPDGAPAPCTFARITRNPDFETEDVLAYQLGYRSQPFERLFLDVAAFYNDFDSLLSLTPGQPFFEAEPPLPHGVFPLLFTNAVKGESYGVELSATARLASWCSLTGSYSYLDIELSAPTGVSGAEAETGSPRNQVSLLAALDGPWGLHLDGVLRYVDTIRVNNQIVPSYVTFDVRLAAQVTDSLELSAVGQNLAQAEHLEWAPGSEVPRGMYAQARWQW